jgi:O-antigen/teichoic acid export membrane protein
MRSIKNRLQDEVYKRPFAVKIFKLSISLGLGQLVYLAASPVISRFFTPADFGHYGMIFTLVAATSVLSAMGYEQAIPLPKDRFHAAAVFLISALFCIFVTVAFVLATTALIYWNGFDYGKLPLYAALLGGTLLLAQGALQVIQSARVRDEDLAGIGRSSLWINVTRAATHIVFGLLGMGFAGLVAGETLCRVAGATQLLLRRPPISLWGDLFSVTWADMRQQLSTYRHVATVLLPPQVVDMCIPIIIMSAIGWIFGAEAAGKYFFVKRVMDVPLALVARTLADALYGRLATVSRSSPELVPPLVIKFASVTIVFAILMCVPLLFLGETMFAWLFGETWREAGLIAAIMAPALAFQTAVSPLGRVITLSNRPVLRYCYTASLLVLLGLTLSAVQQFNLSFLSAIAGISFSTSVAYMIYFIAIYVSSKDIRIQDNDSNSLT